MRLYTRTGATALTDPVTGHTYEADAEGGFGFPNEFSDRIGGFCTNGKPHWETEAQRSQRLATEDRQHSQDPATLLAAIREQGVSNKAVLEALAAALGAKSGVEAPVVAEGAPDLAGPGVPERAEAKGDTAPPPIAAAAKRRGRAAGAE
jgi:hypothetical protein